MINKRIIAAVVSAVLLLSLCGCQLAVSGKGITAITDELCGMFITFKPLYSDDDIDVAALMNGVPQSGASERKPIYAKPKDNGDGMLKYEFEGIEGVPFLVVCEKGGGGKGYTWVDCSDDSVDVNININRTDTSEKIKFEGTLFLYVNPDLYKENGDVIIYGNPVYKNPENEVYMLPADGGVAVYIDRSNNEDVTGFNVGTSVSGTSTIKNGNETESRTVEAAITVKGINNIQKYVLKEMSDKDELVNSTEITKDSIPDAVTLKSGTSYAILEGYNTDKNGKTVIERSVVDMSMEYFSVRFPGNTGVAKKHNITMNNRPVSDAS